MKTTIEGVGIAERQIVNAVLSEIPPSKTNREIVRNLRRSFDIKGLRDEVNEARSIVIQDAMDRAISGNLVEALKGALKRAEVVPDETAEHTIRDTIERTVRTVAGPHLLQTIKLSWEDLLAAEAQTTTFEVDATNLAMFRKFYEEKEDWAWNDQGETVAPPSAMHEALANLDEAIEAALKK